MKTQQVNFRIEADLLDALQREANEEFIDRATMIRKLLREGMVKRRIERALLRFQRDEISLGRACEESGLGHWAMLRLMRERGLTSRETPEQAVARFGRLVGKAGRVAETARPYRGPGRRAALGTSEATDTLPDRPPKRGGVLLVGINPAPVSVTAGHYWQGRLGKRMWQRLGRLGLLSNPTPGREDDAFVAAGHGLTDIVKRATASAADIGADEMRLGAETLRGKVERWSPKLVLFVFRDAARAALGARTIAPGPCAAFEGVPTFLLTGPYATGEQVHANDEALLAVVGTREAGQSVMSQTITANDIRQGCIRFPRDAMSLFPKMRGDVDVVIRGDRQRVPYDPRPGPDRERSGRLRVGREVLKRLVRAGERLHVHVGSEGLLHLD